MAISKGVTLYTDGTPNGWKVSVLLEELKYPYKVRHIDIMGAENEQKQPWYLKINPNGRIPAIVDHDNDDFAVFETGAVMLYLAEKAGALYPTNFNRRSEVMQWLMFQMGGIGPMQGQADHFIVFAKEQIYYAKKRYYDEVLRLYEVLDNRLNGRQYIAGSDESADAYSIADIATWTWVHIAPVAGIRLESFEHLSAWHARIGAREAVCAGLGIPKVSTLGLAKKLQGLADDPAAYEKYLMERQAWMAEA